MNVRVERETWGDEGRWGLTILVDEKKGFSVHDGEPEDNTLNRNFNGCLRIPELMKLAFQAGERGEKFEVENVEVNEDDS